MNAAAAGLALLLAAGCSGGKSYAVVTVRSATGEFPSAAQFLVHVITEARRATLFYPPSPGGPYPVSTSDTVDFSVSFSDSHMGLLTIGVAPRDREGYTLGYGEAEKPIEPGQTMKMEVLVKRDELPPPLDGVGVGAAPSSP